MMPAPRVFAVTIASTTRRTSAAPRMAGSESNHALNDESRATGFAKSSTRALLWRDDNGYVLTPDRSNSSYGNGMAPSEYQHGVTVTIEAIAAVNGLPVRLEDSFASSECRNEHQQRRARQMEVRDHRVDELEAVSRMDEQRGFAAARLHVALGCDRQRFKRAHGRRANSDDAASFSFRARERSGGFR